MGSVLAGILVKLLDKYGTTYAFVTAGILYIIIICVLWHLISKLDKSEEKEN